MNKLTVHYLFFILAGLGIRQAILFIVKNSQKTYTPKNYRILKNALFAYLFLFPAPWIIFIEFSFGYDFWENLMDDDLKFYIPFLAISSIFGYLSWALTLPNKTQKKITYFAIFLGYGMCIGILYVAYSLSHFGF